MRTATILAAALAATFSTFAAPTQNVAFTKPLWDRPADLPEQGETWPKAPTFTSPLLKAEAPPKVVIIPAPGQAAPPEEDHLHRGPDSEEWHCLVPLQDRQAPATTVTLNRCQTPSLEPGDLLHLL
jgi:hypothetical protein